MMFLKSTIVLGKSLLICFLYFVLPLRMLGAIGDNAYNMPGKRLNPEISSYCIQEFSRFLSVRDEHLSPEEAWQRRSEFLTWEYFSLRHDEKEIWIYFTLTNATPQLENFYLSGQLTDFVDLYRVHDDRPELVSSSGYLIPFEKRSVLDWGAIVCGPVASKSESAYLLRLKSITRNSRYLMDYAIPKCMKLYTENGYETSFKLHKYFTYFFLGVVSIICIYNLLIFVSTFYREYYLISIYNVATLLFCFFVTEAHLETGLMKTADWIRNVQYICIAVIYLSYLIFSIKFLDLKINAPRMYLLLKWVRWIYLLIITILIFSYYEIAFYLTVATVTFSYVIVLSCSIRLSVGMPSARFLLAGNLVVSIMAILHLLNLMDWVSPSRTAHTVYTLQIIELVIFSFAVAHKLRTSKRIMYKIRHQNEIQRERLKMEEEMRRQLEMDVNQKARSLTTTSIQLLNFNDKLTEILDKVKFDIRVGNDPFRYVVRELSDLKKFENSWQSIKTHFESVHPDFFSKLEYHFPNLTPNDHKLLVFLKMKLSNKEIAIVMNVTRRAVEQAKRRIKKKLGMNVQDMDIIGFIENSSFQSEPDTSKVV